jgi:hypothetical protein
MSKLFLVYHVYMLASISKLEFPSCGQSNKNHVSYREKLKRWYMNCGWLYNVLVADKFFRRHFYITNCGHDRDYQT